MLSYNYLLQSALLYNKSLQTNFTSFKLSRNLMIQKKKIDNELSIYLELEKKLIDKYAKKDDNGQPIVGEDGIIEFDSEDNKAEFIREIIELKNTTIDNFEKVTIYEDNFRNTNDIPSPNEMLALEEVIDWQ
jgi:hypothetical protein